MHANKLRNEIIINDNLARVPIQVVVSMEVYEVMDQGISIVVLEDSIISVFYNELEPGIFSYVAMQMVAKLEIALQI